MNQQIRDDVFAGVDELQECLRTELSALETYQLALEHVSHVGMRSVLQQLLNSHAARADLLEAVLIEMGAEATRTSGVWGALTRTLQAGADIFGERAAIAALEEGERRALRLYQEARDRVDAPVRQLIDGSLLPEQRHTASLCASLSDYASVPS
jgi:hypothetical protein